MRLQGNDKISRKYYLLRCKKGHCYPVSEDYLRAGRLRTCKMCNHPTILEADPEFATWFVDPSIPQKRPCGCHDKADFYCQRCGKIVRNKSINNVHKRREVPCPYCVNGVSYPERYLIALFEHMQIAFVHQYTVRLVRNGRDTCFKYDFYDPERRLLIETHGQQHYEAGAFERFSGQSLEQIQENDAEKARYASETLHMSYVELDCRRSDPSWIRREITAKLSCYPLEKIDWTAVRQNASKSVLLEIIALAKQGVTRQKISEIVHLHVSTVSQKLRQAQCDGLFDGITPQLLEREKKKRQKAQQQKNRLQKKMKDTPAKLSRREICSSSSAPRKKTDPSESLPPGITLIRSGKDARSRSDFLCTACGQNFSISPAALLKHGGCPICRKYESFLKDLELKYPNEYEVLSSCQDLRTPVKVLHRICGETFQKNASSLLRKGCSICAERMRIERANETRRNLGTQKFFDLLPEFERLGYPYSGKGFQGFGNKNAFRCSHCGELWWTTAKSILDGRNHICISPCRKKTPDEFRAQIRELTGEEYSVLSEYQSATAPVKLRHNTCGLVYLVTPAHFISGNRRCPACAKKGVRLPDPALLEKLQNVYADWDERTNDDNQQYIGFLDYTWERHLEDLTEFYLHYGHTNVPPGYLARGFDLCEWVSGQRKAYRQGRLSEDRIRRLESLNIIWNVPEHNWQKTYDAIRSYWIEHDHTLPDRESSPKELRYDIWIQEQIKRGRKKLLSSEKVSLLADIGIRFDYHSDVQFDAMCDKLRRFAQEHGHCIVPLDEGHGETAPLGLWAQRMRLQMAAGTLSPDRAALLIKIGLPVNNKDAKFQNKLEKLKLFRKEHGHLRIPQSYVENGDHLGRWINSFRVRYAKGQLSPHQISALEEIGMVWNAAGSDK